MKKNNVLLKQVRLVTPGKAIAKAQDILVRNGIIAEIGNDLTADPEVDVWHLPNAHVSIGWMDVGVSVCDPGYEHREDLQSVTAAAAAGGFTAIAPFPNTHPAIHSKSEVNYLLSKTAAGSVRFYPLGALSHDCAGKDLAELFDMYHAGAVAFTDGAQSIQDAGLLLRAMEYAKAFNGLIINRPYSKSLAAGGQMHEGIVSTSLGLKGLSSLSEYIGVQRDLSLLQYAGAGARLHLHLLSTAESVAFVREAKAAGLPVTASVALANLCFTDETLAMQEGSSPFDTDLKCMPPLRSENDRNALLEGLLDGTIDFIATNHTPWDTETKNLEFPYAEFGMTGLETALPMYCMYLADRLPLDKWVDAIAVAPRRVLGIDVPEIAVGAPANLTIFSPDGEWTVSRETMRSKSYNTPMLGKTVTGKVIFTMA